MIGFLYGQSEYQLLENTISLNKYIDFIKEEGFSFASITNNNLIGTYKFYKLCQKNGIKPIIGLEVILDKKNHLLFYAKNYQGYINLVEIETLKNKKNDLTYEDLKPYQEGLFLVTGASLSNLEYYIVQMNKEAFIKELEDLTSLNKNLYIGVDPRTLAYGTICDDLKKLAKEFDLKLLPTLKSSYLEEDYDAYQMLLKIGNKEDNDEDYSLKTKNEIIELYSDFNEVFDNLDEFNNQIELFDIKKEIKLPEILNRNLEKEANVGLNKRLRLTGLEDQYDVYKKRLDYELEIIKKMGYENYFLIVSEYVTYAKKSGILVGPGRGSGASSLVSYCLGINDVDPIKYNLLFERFLNPERISMPDIDVDFPDIKREDVIKHVCEKYSYDNVSYISTFQTFGAKSIIRDLFRINNLDLSYLPMVTKLLDDDKSINESLSNHQELIDIVKIAKKLEGLPKNISTHASGIILAGEKLSHLIPLRMGANNILQAEYDGHDLEELGFLKMDFLGISHLSLIDEILKEINVKFNDIPLDDLKTYELLQRGDTLGIFQLEGKGFTDALVSMKPNSFKDVYALLALFRPGPKDMIPTYVERKNGKKFEYYDSSLEDILKETYGIIIYQEQIMLMAQRVSNFSLGEADILRRGIGKKDYKLLEQQKNTFIDRAIKNGYSKEKATYLFDLILKFGDYGFNKSHSVAYSLISYKMAYLKANYPSAFFAKSIDFNFGNKELVNNYIKEAKKYNVNIIGPNINESIDKAIVKENTIILPLGIVKAVSKDLVNDITNARKDSIFKDFKDFKKRVYQDKYNEGIINLIDACAFDTFNETHINLKKYTNDEAYLYMAQDEIIKDSKEYDESELIKNEREALGFNLKYDYFKNYESLKNEYKASSYQELVEHKKANIIGIIKNKKVINDKNNKKMAFATIDLNGTYIDIILFEEVYQEYGNCLDEKGLLLINGNVRIKDKKKQLQVIKMRKI